MLQIGFKIILRIGRLVTMTSKGVVFGLLLANLDLESHVVLTSFQKSLKLQRLR